MIYTQQMNDGTSVLFHTFWFYCLIFPQKFDSDAYFTKGLGYVGLEELHLREERNSWISGPTQLKTTKFAAYSVA